MTVYVVLAYNWDPCYCDDACNCGQEEPEIVAVLTQDSPLLRQYRLDSRFEIVEKELT